MVFLNVFSTLEIWMFFLWKNIHGFFSRCFLKDWISPPCVHRKGSWPRCVPVWGEATVWKICWHKIVFDFSFAELFDRISYMFQNPNSIVIQRSGKITSSIFKYSMFKRKIDQKTVHLPIFHCLFCGSCSSQLPPPGGKFPDKFRWSSTHRFCDINVPKTTFSHGKTKIKKNGPWPPVGNFLKNDPKDEKIHGEAGWNPTKLR